MQVGPLKDQSEKAKKFLVLRDDLRVREISSWMETLDQLHKRSEAVNAEYTETKILLEKARAELEALYASSGSLTERMHAKDEESERARERLSAREAEIAACDSSIAVLQADIRSSESAEQRMAKDISEQETRVEEIRANIAQNEKRLSEVKGELSELAEQLRINSNVLNGCRMKIQTREEAMNAANDRANRLSVEARSLEQRIAMLTEMEKDFEGYSKAVKTVMREASRGNLRGVHGPVSNLIRADEECALAIETALGAAGQNIVIDERNDGRAAIEMLKRSDGGRATFLPLDTIKGGVMRDAPVNDTGFVGIAYELVRFDARYEQIVANLLGKTIVVETLADAIRISRNGNDRYRIVTLDGQMIHVGGSMTGGSSARGTGVLSRANELEKLRDKRKSLEALLSNCSAELTRARSDLAVVRNDLDIAMEDRNALSAKESSLNAEAGAVSNTARQFRLLLDSLTGDSETRRRAITDAKKHIEALQQQLAEKQDKRRELIAAAEEIRKEIDEISRSKMELEGRRTRAEKTTQERNSELIELERKAARIEQKKLSADLEEKQILDKLWDSYELSYSAAQDLRRPVENLQRANREIAELRRQISALGSPNIGAIEEYERVSTRYEFLSSQRDDVEKAKGELLGIIRDVTKEMKAVFSDQFRQINTAFQQTFKDLFGGGKASLELEDEDNILECGIEIRCQPPGKALSTLSLMSGGEMAFVAIALYFAILKVRPTPFCVMDEIEAALDEANVNRYADYMRRMADRTQFIVITHRRGTMEEADMLYGVVMQEKGVSSVLELDFEQATKTAEV